MRKSMLLVTSLLVLGQVNSAYAHCTGYHPHHCSVSGVLGGVSSESKKFFEDVSRETTAALDGIDRAWKDAYHQAFPLEMREIINETLPLSIATYILGVNPEIIAYAMGLIIVDSTHRANQGKQVANGVTWKENMIAAGNAKITGNALSSALLTSKTNDVRISVDAIWNTFLECMRVNDVETQARINCLNPMQKAVNRLVEDIQDETSASAR